MPIYPAIDFIQADRTGWITKMTIEEILELIPPRPAEQLALLTDTNRPVNQRHVDDIEKFLSETTNWAMPSIALAAERKCIETDPKKQFTINAPQGSLGILDGQHRIQAMHNLMGHLGRVSSQQGAVADAATEQLNNMRGSELSVVIYEVRDIADQQQLFAWFARNRPIETPIRAKFDQSDPINAVAQRVIRDSVMLQGRVNESKSSISGEDRNMMVLEDLKRIVLTIAIGIQRPRPVKTETLSFKQSHKQDEMFEQTIAFFDDFLPTCGEAYEQLAGEDAASAWLSFQRNGTYAFDAPVLRLFANAWARWTVDSGNAPEPLAQYIRGLNLLKTSPANHLITTFQVVDGDSRKFKGVRDKTWFTATSHIIGILQEETGKSQLLR